MLERSTCALQHLPCSHCTQWPLLLTTHRTVHTPHPKRAWRIAVAEVAVAEFVVASEVAAPVVVAPVVAAPVVAAPAVAAVPVLSEVVELEVVEVIEEVVVAVAAAAAHHNKVPPTIREPIDRVTTQLIAKPRIAFTTATTARDDTINPTCTRFGAIGTSWLDKLKRGDDELSNNRDADRFFRELFKREDSTKLGKYEIEIVK